MQAYTISTIANRSNQMNKRFLFSAANYLIINVGNGTEYVCYSLLSVLA
jgi:hypothetical protein